MTLSPIWTAVGPSIQFGGFVAIGPVMFV